MAMRDASELAKSLWQKPSLAKLSLANLAKISVLMFWAAQNFAFFSSPTTIFSLSSLSLGSFKSAGALKCARFEFSGCRVKPWRPRPSRPRPSGPRASGPRPSGPTLRGPTLRGPTRAIPTLAKRSLTSLAERSLASTKFGQCQVWPDFVSKVGRGRRVGRSGSGPVWEGVGLGGDPEGWRSPTLRAFFPLPPQLSFFLLLGVFSWNFGGVFEGRGPQMCTFKVLGLWFENPALL